MENSSSSILTQKLDFTKALETFKRDGCLIVDQFLSPMPCVDLHHLMIKRVEAGPSGPGTLGKGFENQITIYADHPLTLGQAAVRLAVEPQVIQLIEAYLENDILLSYVTAYRNKVVDGKHARRRLDTPGVFTGWHSDANIIGKDRAFRSVVAMYYLSPVDKGCGALELVKGSHLYGGGKRAWFPEQEIQDFDSKLVEVHGKAGTLILFDMEMIHRAGIPSSMSRDIIRMAYTPVGGYTETLMISTDAIPKDLSEKAQQVLRFGHLSHTHLPISAPAGAAVAPSRSQVLIKKVLNRLGVAPTPTAPMNY